MSGATLGMTGLYNTNSKYQLEAIQLSIPYIEQAIDVLDLDSSSSLPLIIADFGTSHGLNSINIMKIIINYLQKRKKILREPLVIHNDLPTNDWKSVINLLLQDNSYHGVINARSFYEQCLPNNSLSIAYSSTSIHWLSKKPCNVSNHCYVQFSNNPHELEAFQKQSYIDYNHFLENRSCELHFGGVLIIAIAINDTDGSITSRNHMNELYTCAQSLPLTPEELLDFTIPFYLPSYEECINEELFAKYSFQLINSALVTFETPLLKQWQQGQITLEELARLNTLYIRAWSESILKQAFINNGRSSEHIDDLLDKFYHLVEQRARKTPHAAIDGRLSYVYVILKKIGTPLHK
ncbi:unnamed protein product [Rotaria sp. Silwood1]|nr:unnamed protein product [Rotaria sp. Silwood1]CAF3854733.1 unnamed protein product [Rotaria sp. Silwood1]CAF3891286.1 unnamed protein product [Rotaria sp. Silwood1]CAF3979560.1 unnamed protein product [Rotaria sp. Silwood1]CAF4629493.1 unnamed protein product [Rotaria sp. Silwood1]